MKDILKHIFHSQSLKAEFSVGKSQRVSAKRGEGEGGGRFPHNYSVIIHDPNQA